MENESLIVGNSNWAVKANNLLGYAVGETSGYYVPRELNFTRNSTATYTDENGIIILYQPLPKFSDVAPEPVWLITPVSQLIVTVFITPAPRTLNEFKSVEPLPFLPKQENTYDVPVTVVNDLLTSA